MSTRPAPPTDLCSTRLKCWQPAFLPFQRKFRRRLNRVLKYWFGMGMGRDLNMYRIWGCRVASSELLDSCKVRMPQGQKGTVGETCFSSIVMEIAAWSDHVMSCILEDNFVWYKHIYTSVGAVSGGKVGVISLNGMLASPDIVHLFCVKQLAK